MGAFGGATAAAVAVVPVAGFYEPVVARIAQASGEDWPGSAAEVREFLGRGGTYGQVALERGLAVGYCLLEVRRRGINIDRVVTDPGHRRRGVASALVREVLRAGAARNRGHAAATVREDDRAAWYFLRAHGFRAVRLVRGCYGGLDGIRLVREFTPGEVVA